MDSKALAVSGILLKNVISILKKYMISIVFQTASYANKRNVRQNV
jgi:hypothetical protein